MTDPNDTDTTDTTETPASKELPAEDLDGVTGGTGFGERWDQ
jgi:hypothetical protein